MPRGQAIVEFLLLTPVLLIVCFLFAVTAIEVWGRPTFEHHCQRALREAVLWKQYAHGPRICGTLQNYLKRSLVGKASVQTHTCRLERGLNSISLSGRLKLPLQKQKAFHCTYVQKRMEDQIEGK